MEFYIFIAVGAVILLGIGIHQKKIKKELILNGKGEKQLKG